MMITGEELVKRELPVQFCGVMRTRLLAITSSSCSSLKTGTTDIISNVRSNVLVSYSMRVVPPQAKVMDHPPFHIRIRAPLRGPHWQFCPLMRSNLSRPLCHHIGSISVIVLITILQHSLKGTKTSLALNYDSS